MTFGTLIEKVLKDNKNKPMSGTEIWKYAISKGYDKKISSQGKKPNNTMTSILYTDMKKNPENQKFQIHGNNPKKFSLKR